MSRKTFIVAVLLLNIALSQAVFLKKPSSSTFSVFNQLKEVEEMPFGKKILDTIELQLKNQSPLGDIARMLAEIRADLVLQQQTADQLHNSQEMECEEEIAEFNRRIDVASATRDEAEAEITILKGDIAQLEADIRNKGAQLEILSRREVALNEDRERDAADFERRQTQGVEVIGALDLIIEKLSTIQPNEGNTQAALAELAKIGSSNPILALVQVASTFSEKALASVIGKMEELRTGIEASLEDDKKNEEQAVNDFHTLLAEVDQTRRNVYAAKQEAETRLKQQQGALALQERILEEAVAELKRANEDKIAKQAQCEDWRLHWAQEKEKRSAEINVVKQVESIIATKLETMKDYIKERANEE